MVQLIVLLLDIEFPLLHHFNSTMVQLIGIFMWKMGRGVCNFNSTMVQLIVSGN